MKLYCWLVLEILICIGSSLVAYFTDCDILATGFIGASLLFLVEYIRKIITSKVVIISGGFDPVHKGHIEYMKMAKDLAGPNGKVVAILNSDDFLIAKKGYYLMDYNNRETVLQSIKYVDKVVKCVDKDQTVCRTLELLAVEFRRSKIIFAKGGDRNVSNIPEKDVCEKLGITIADGLGEKIESSSTIVNSLINTRKKK